MITQKIKNFFNRVLLKKRYRIQTFTYYIPSPPPRKTGYREKQFDGIFYRFINLGYEILSVHTQANNGPEHSGMWFICTVRALNKKADQLDLSLFSNEINEHLSQPNSEGDSAAAKSNSQTIEGLYYLD